jgi:NAD(P)-dependent dehydrogenase (short-subunit alcohol dehydrogenase family)
MPEPIAPLAGKVAIVTGAGSVTDRRTSMGPVMAKALFADGASVAGIDVNEDGLARLAARLGTGPAGQRFLPVACDVSDPAACEAAVGRITRELGPPDILVNHAGIGQSTAAPPGGKYPFPFWQADPAVWKKMQEVNSMGPFLLARLAVPAMIARHWGRIVNTATSYETMLDAWRNAYGPSKAALESSSAIWAKELAGTGVTVNCLLPGGMVASNSHGLRNAPAERMLSAEIMGPPIRWLASPAADGVTGRRFVARLWDPNLSGAENAARQDNPIGWPGLGLGRTAPVAGF